MQKTGLIDKAAEFQRYFNAQQSRTAMLKSGALLENTRTLNQCGINRTEAPDSASTTSLNLQNLQNWLPPG